MKFTFKDSNGDRIVINAKNEDEARKKLKKKVKNLRQYRMVKAQDKELNNLLEDSVGYRELPRREGR